MTRQLKNAMGPHRQNLYMIAVCLGALAALFLLTVSKDLRTRRQLEAQLSEASRSAERYQALTPLMAELQKNDAAPMPGDTGLPDPQELADAPAEDYETVIGRILRQCNLRRTLLTPNIQSVLSDRDYILVDLTAQGAFSNFRDLILQLGRLPFVSGIEHYRIQRVAEAGELEMLLQLRIQVVSSGDSFNEDQ